MNFVHFLEKALTLDTLQECILLEIEKRAYRLKEYLRNEGGSIHVRSFAVTSI